MTGCYPETESESSFLSAVLRGGWVILGKTGLPNPFPVVDEPAQFTTLSVSTSKQFLVLRMVIGDIK